MTLGEDLGRTSEALELIHVQDAMLGLVLYAPMWGAVPMPLTTSSFCLEPSGPEVPPSI